MGDELRREVSYFNQKTREYRDEYDRETAEGYSFRVRREKVLAMIESGSNVLDIASGPGIMVKGLLGKGCTVTCVDAAPEMIARIREEFGGRDRLTALVADAYNLPFPDQSFDIATAMGLIEYLDDENIFLREAGRVLKNSGTLIITFPNYWAPWRIVNRISLFILRLFRQKKNGGIIHREYTRSRAQKLLAENGFKSEEVRYYNFKLVPYPLDRLLPRFTVFLSKLFEHFDKTPLRWLGTAFIVKARKR